MEQFAAEVLDVLDGLPVSVAALRRSGIGKTVFKLRSRRKDGEGPSYDESLRRVLVAGILHARKSGDRCHARCARSIPYMKSRPVTDAEMHSDGILMMIAAASELDQTEELNLRGRNAGHDRKQPCGRCDVASEIMPCLRSGRLRLRWCRSGSIWWTRRKRPPRHLRTPLQLPLPAAARSRNAQGVRPLTASAIRRQSQQRAGEITADRLAKAPASVMSR